MGMNGRLSRELRKFCLIISQKKGGGWGISNLLPQCSMTFPHTALQDSILRLPTMSKCLGRNKNQLTSSIFDLNIIKTRAILLRSMIYPLRKTRQRQTRRTVNKDKDKPKLRSPKKLVQTSSLLLGQHYCV